MASSVNGWRVLTRSECVDVEVPGGVLPVHPEFAVLAWDCAHLWDETVEALEAPLDDEWGWAAPRPIRGAGAGGPVTNHASGTAWDLNATKHPRGVPIARTFTRDQLEAVARMEARYFGVLRWGGRWTGPDVDGMHWEGAPGVTLEDVRRLSEQLRAEAEAPAKPAPAKPAPKPAGWTGPDLRGYGLNLRADAPPGGQINGPRVQALQLFWRSRYPLYAGRLQADGYWGPATSRVCAEFARRSGIRGADGLNIGPKIAARLHGAGFRG